ncbi:hypothetical protein [Novacetimonas sp. GS1]
MKVKDCGNWPKSMKFSVKPFPAGIKVQVMVLTPRAAFAGIMGIFDNELKISDFSRGCLKSQAR